MLNTLIQVIVAIFLIIILAIIAYSVYNKEIQDTVYNMTKSVVVKKPVPIFKGVMPLTSSVKPKYSTSDPANGTFRDLQPSINQKGGAEYSYNFWIHNNTLDVTDNSTVLFLRGNDTMIEYKSNNNCMTKKGTNKKWFLVKNPLVRVYIDTNKKIESVITEFNSITHPDAFHVNSEEPVCSSDDHEDMFGNHLGIFGISNRNDLENKWIMITLVVKETNPDTDILFRNKAVVKMYLNGFEQLNKNADVKYNGSGSTAMKHNQGNLYINPGDNTKNDNITDNSQIQMADLTYYNYALTTDEIKSLHTTGVTKGPATIPSEATFDLKNSDEAKLEITASNYIKEY
jgi:hypothetical protein